ncbi:MAG: energy transducer TonB [Deltaproteobacteria bacterium]|nr:energy transducer TonB [Deltaproteobacteria bacterium]
MTHNTSMQALNVVPILIKSTRRNRNIELRHLRRRRVQNKVKHAISEEVRNFDPLRRRQNSKAAKVASLIVLIAGGIVAHVALLAVAFAVAGVIGNYKTPQIEREHIIIQSIDKNKDPLETLEKPKMDKPLTRLKAKPKPQVKKVEPVKQQEPPPDPINEPKTPTPPPRAAPRRIVGLSMESTVAGSGGPSFAVGNTRMGTTAKHAEDPNSVSKLPAQKNRVSMRIAKAGVTIKPPKKIKETKPSYPPVLKAQGIEGDVVLRINIDANGRVTQVKIIKSSGFDEFDKAAVKAAKIDSWAAATYEGEPVADVITYTVRFRLTDA